MKGVSNYLKIHNSIIRIDEIESVIMHEDYDITISMKNGKEHEFYYQTHLSQAEKKKAISDYKKIMEAIMGDESTGSLYCSGCGSLLIDTMCKYCGKENSVYEKN